MTRVEFYSDSHYLDVVRLVKNFHKEAVSEYDNIFDPETLIETIQKLKETNSNNAFLLIVDGVCEGILAGFETKSMINGNRIFQEIIWYVNAPYRRHGISLLKTAEKSLKSSGISIMIMAVLENSKTEKIKKFYERLGYKPMEAHYMRSL